jgi:hypothetical protein
MAINTELSGKMYSKLPHFILGFHGCSKETYHKVLHENKFLETSKNDYDWLGHGIYFWEQDYRRALDWAKEKYGNNFGVIGAIIDLGYCLNLSDTQYVAFLKVGYETLESRLGKEKVPKNRGKRGNDMLLRDLDCAVIQQIHELTQDLEIGSFDSVRGLFIEGEQVYPGSGFCDKTHIQICVVNPNCIKGYFSPLIADESYSIP